MCNTRPGRRGRVAKPAVNLLLSTKLLALLTLLLTTLGGCSHNEWVLFRGVGGRGHTRNPLTPPLGIRWELALQSGGERAFAFNNLAVTDDTLYFGATDGNFYAMSIATGYMNWVFRTGAPVNSVPYADRDRVYFGSNDGHVYALDRRTGTEIWRHFAGSTVQSTVFRFDDTIVFAADGAGVWFLDLAGRITHGIDNPVWHRVALQVVDGVMYMTPGPPQLPFSLGAYDVRDHRHLWLLPVEIMEATWYSFPAVTRRHMLIQTSRNVGNELEFRTYALDRATGTIQWTRRFPAEFGTDRPANVFSYWIEDRMNVLDYQAPAIWRDRVITTAGDTIVRALREGDGTIEWETALSHRTSSAPMISGDHVFVGVFGDEGSTRGFGSAPRLLALSARSGAVVWELETNGAIYSPPVVAGRYMVFGTDRNYVYVLERVF